LNIDTKTDEGKRYFQGIQKIGVLFFIVFEAIIYVVMRGLEAAPGYSGIVITQLILGGLAIMYMDEVSQKWGFGSGVSLFIVAGVAWRLFTGLFQFIGTQGQNCLVDFTGTSYTPCTGRVFVIIQSIINGAPTEAVVALATIIATAVIFVGVVWAQSLKVEVPLTYDRLRGYGVKWPLAFFYTSVLPVILVSALIANIQLFASLLENWFGRATILGGFSSSGQAISGFSYWVGSSNLLELILRQSTTFSAILQGITHLITYMFLSMVFAIFWMKTSNMDAGSQAKNIISSGLQIPGFRKDERVLESILSR